MSAIATPRRPAARPRTATTTLDSAGRAWRHHDPLRLYRWIARRNNLLWYAAHRLARFARRFGDRA